MTDVVLTPEQERLALAIGDMNQAGVVLRIGQILDVLAPQVRRSPGYFEFPSRPVTPEDIERMLRLEALEHEPGA